MGMVAYDLLIFLIALLSEVAGTVSGFGSSTFFVPVTMFLENFHLVLMLTAILHVTSNSTKLVLFRGPISYRKCIPLAAASIVCTGVGAVLTSVVPVTALKICLGFVLMFISANRFLSRYVSSPSATLVLTGISGFFTGLVGTGGAIRAVALQAMGLEKNAFVFASSLIDFGGDAVRAGVYIREGYLDWRLWYYIPLVISAAALGPWIGRGILAKIKQSTFEKIVSVLIFVSGLLLVIEWS